MTLKEKIANAESSDWLRQGMTDEEIVELVTEAKEEAREVKPMKIVIEIHEKDYQSMINGHIPFSVLDAIMNGTPLPEHHGRLIDANDLEECKEIMNTIMGESKYAIRMDDVRNTSTIIEGSES